MVTAEYPEDFLGIFTINYAAMKYQMKNDQLNHLDGDKARMDIGREECKVYMQGAEDKPVIANTSKGIRVRHGSARRKFSRVYPDAPDPHSSDAGRVPGGTGGADGESITEARATDGRGTRWFEAR